MKRLNERFIISGSGETGCKDYYSCIRDGGGQNCCAANEICTPDPRGGPATCRQSANTETTPSGGSGGSGGSEAGDVVGCMNPNTCNYNPNANVPGGCVPPNACGNCVGDLSCFEGDGRGDGVHFGSAPESGSGSAQFWGDGGWNDCPVPITNENIGYGSAVYTSEQQMDRNIAGDALTAASAAVPGGAPLHEAVNLVVSNAICTHYFNEEIMDLCGCLDNILLAYIDAVAFGAIEEGTSGTGTIAAAVVAGVGALSVAGAVYQCSRGGFRLRQLLDCIHLHRIEWPTVEQIIDHDGGAWGGNHYVNEFKRQVACKCVLPGQFDAKSMELRAQQCPEWLVDEWENYESHDEVCPDHSSPWTYGGADIVWCGTDGCSLNSHDPTCNSIHQHSHVLKNCPCGYRDAPSPFTFQSVGFRGPGCKLRRCDRCHHSGALIKLAQEKECRSRRLAQLDAADNLDGEEAEAIQRRLNYLDVLKESYDNTGQGEAKCCAASFCRENVAPESQGGTGPTDANNWNFYHHRWLQPGRLGRGPRRYTLVTAILFLSIDIATIGQEGTDTRISFINNFKHGVAHAIRNMPEGGPPVQADQILILEIIGDGWVHVIDDHVEFLEAGSGTSEESETQHERELARIGLGEDPVNNQVRGAEVQEVSNWEVIWNAITGGGGRSAQRPGASGHIPTHSHLDSELASPDGRAHIDGQWVEHSNSVGIKFAVLPQVNGRGISRQVIKSDQGSTGAFANDGVFLPALPSSGIAGYTTASPAYGVEEVSTPEMSHDTNEWCGTTDGKPLRYGTGAGERLGARRDQGKQTLAGAGCQSLPESDSKDPMIPTNEGTTTNSSTGAVTGTTPETRTFGSNYVR